MKNEARQKQLDELKWLNSEDYGYDLSGKMPYCYNCQYQLIGAYGCKVSQQERAIKCYCAKAYNKSSR